MTIELGEKLSAVGKRIPRVDAGEKAAGQAVYAVDVELPGMLHVRVLRAGVPHARIVKIDTSRAEALPGVAAVATGRDLPALSGIFIQDQPSMAVDRVRYPGEAVAAVAACDLETAEAALQLIDVTYEKLPPIFDPMEAAKAGSSLLHPDLHTYGHIPSIHPVAGTNVCNHLKVRKGNPEQGFAEADHIFEDWFTSHRIQHTFLEPEAAAAQVDFGGRVTVWSNTQAPSLTRKMLARALGRPINRVRVIGTRVGGGFGGKLPVRMEGIVVALALKTSPRPVKLVMTREEELIAGSMRHPIVARYKTGVKRDGTLTAMEIEVYWDTGAYADYGPNVCNKASYSGTGPYRVPHVKIDGYCVYTNNPVSGAFRGFGTPQMTWANEVQLDKIAERLGLDSFEIRLKNALVEGDEIATGQRVESVGLIECLRAVADALDWKSPKRAPNRGKGLACMHKATITPSFSTAFMKLNADLSAEILSSTVEMGQGSDTLFCQIVAEVLGIEPGNVYIGRPDTDFTPDDFITSGSRATFYMGNAVRLAAEDVRAQLKQEASRLLGVPENELELGGGKVYPSGMPEAGVPYAKIIGILCAGKDGVLVGKGFFRTTDYIPLDPETGQGKTSDFWMYAVQGAEVEVDRETGKVKVLRIVAAHDVGRAMNPTSCEQQIEGAAVMGVSSALYEELLVKEGKTLNPMLTDYKIPTSLDAPEIQSILVEVPHREGPFGAKGLGEPGLAAIAPAIAGAVCDAVGVRFHDTPLNAERVWRALREMEQQRVS